MELKTILDAMLMADRRRIAPAHIQRITPNVQRQYRAFRARILRMFDEKETRIWDLTYDLEISENNRLIMTDIAKRIRKQLAEKDARIAELEKEVKHAEGLLGVTQT